MVTLLGVLEQRALLVRVLRGLEWEDVLNLAAATSVVHHSLRDDDIWRQLWPWEGDAGARPASSTWRAAHTQSALYRHPSFGALSTPLTPIAADAAGDVTCPLHASGISAYGYSSGLLEVYIDERGGAAVRPLVSHVFRGSVRHMQLTGTVALLLRTGQPTAGASAAASVPVLPHAASGAAWADSDAGEHHAPSSTSSASAAGTALAGGAASAADAATAPAPLAFNIADAPRLWVSTWNGDVHCVCLASGIVQTVVSGTGAPIYALKLADDMLFTGCGDGLIRVWRLALQPLEAGAPAASNAAGAHAPGEAADVTTAAAASPAAAAATGDAGTSGTPPPTAASTERRFRVVAIADGVLRGHTGAVTDIAMVGTVPVRLRPTSATPAAATAADGAPAAAPAGAVGTLAAVVASASYDGTVRVWSLGRRGNAPRCTRVLVGHRGPVWTLQCIGGHVFSGGADGTIRHWLLPADVVRPVQHDLRRGTSTSAHPSPQAGPVPAPSSLPSTFALTRATSVSPSTVCGAVGLSSTPTGSGSCSASGDSLITASDCVQVFGASAGSVASLPMPSSTTAAGAAASAAASGFFLPISAGHSSAASTSSSFSSSPAASTTALSPPVAAAPTAGLGLFRPVSGISLPATDAWVPGGAGSIACGAGSSASSVSSGISAAGQIYCLHVVGDCLFVGTSSGLVQCWHARLGTMLWSLRAASGRNGIRRIDIVRDLLYTCTSKGSVSVYKMSRRSPARRHGSTASSAGVPASVSPSLQAAPPAPRSSSGSSAPASNATSSAIPATPATPPATTTTVVASTASQAQVDAALARPPLLIDTTADAAASPAGGRP